MKPTQQLAERLAQGVADYWMMSEHHPYIKDAVLKEIPLLELLEVARASKYLMEFKNTIIRQANEVELEKALSNLKQKLPEL